MKKYNPREQAAYDFFVMGVTKITPETSTRRKYNAMMADVKRVSERRADVESKRKDRIMITPFEELDYLNAKLYKKSFENLFVGGPKSE